MCGISGILTNNKKDTEVVSKVQLMSKKIKHRGPDSTNFNSFNNFHISFNRLSIVGIKNGEQPFINKNKTINVWVNGEIYNYQDIKKNYLKNYKFKTESDCEVVLALYEKFGVEFVKYIRGMFLVVILDTNENEAYFFRDRIGEKPLYYAFIDDEFIFSSELKSFSVF